MGSIEKIKAALKATAIFRGSKPDQPTLTLYSNRLASENEGDVLAALEKLAESKRGEYEAALPDMPTMLALVNVQRIARQNRSDAVKSQRLVRWQCPACKHTKCGFPNTSDALEKRCDKRVDTGKWSPDGWPICGARMEVIFDENDLSSDGPMVKYDLPDWMTRRERETA